MPETCAGLYSADPHYVDTSSVYEPGASAEN
jgi:hypothetical protein